MKKLILFIVILIITPLIAGVYGIIHDQLTYTISQEYFTKFKFIQFHVGEAIPYRLGVSYVGFMATWWVGIPLGIFLGLTGLIHRDGKEMIRLYFKSVVIVLVVAIIVGLFGLLFGRLFLIDKNLNWFFPEDLIDRAHFIMVGSMHNFSYLGGLIGLIVGVIYQIR